MATVEITTNPLIDTPTTGSYLNTGNLVSTIKNHSAEKALSKADSLGVQALGRNTGLALEDANTGLLAHEKALRAGGTATLSTTDVQTVDSGVTINGTQVTY